MALPLQTEARPPARVERGVPRGGVPQPWTLGEDESDRDGHLALSAPDVVAHLRERRPGPRPWKAARQVCLERRDDQWLSWLARRESHPPADAQGTWARAGDREFRSSDRGWAY